MTILNIIHEEIFKLYYNEYRYLTAVCIQNTMQILPPCILI